MKNKKKFIFISIIISIFIALYFVSKNIPTCTVEGICVKTPLLFSTFLIAIIDGFNPCTMWVLTYLLGILISATQHKLKLIVAGYTFIFIIFISYFSYLTALLNIFQFIGYREVLRIIIALIAIIIGGINFKDFFFFKKGVSLTIPDKAKHPLIEKIKKVRDAINKGSLIMIMISSVILALFTVLIEFPCVAGYPIIYAKILDSHGIVGGTYYSYMLLYCVFYIIPLTILINIFIFLFGGGQKTQALKEKYVRYLKLLAGLVMIFIGVILLVAPYLLM